MMNLPAFLKPPRALAFDLDGTLFNSRLEVSDRTRQALEGCLKIEIPLILATSRPERSVIRLAGRELVERCSEVLSNGAISRGTTPLAGRTDHILDENLARDVIRCILEMEPSAQVTVEIEGFEFGMNRRPEAAELWAVNSALPEMLLSLEEALSKGPRKIAVGASGHILTSVKEALDQRFQGSLRVISANQGTFLNIVEAGASKAGAIAGLLKSRAIPLADVVAFGDDLPDLDMLLACGYPVAMANADPQVKAVCPYQTLSNDEDGVAVALEKMLTSGQSCVLAKVACRRLNDWLLFNPDHAWNNS